MKNTLITLTLASALFGGLALQPAFGGDAAEDRFHEAYVLEVVDGKVAGAAKAYLALTLDKGASTRIRNEAEFRFAVCSVILGRVDEARLRLGALLRNAEASAELKSRVQEYLEALKDVGMGTELERKMGELVFELGRQAGDTATPEQYRDFEVIGDAALPFLRELARHTDPALRWHAFRMLVRMNEPNMLDVIPAGVAISGVWICNDVAAYMKRNEGARAKFEAALLALVEARFRDVLIASHGSLGFSDEFIRRAAKRGLSPRTVVGHLLRAVWTPEHLALMTEMIDGDDDALAFQLSLGLAAACANDRVPARLTDELFIGVSRRLTQSSNWVYAGPSGASSRNVAQGLPNWQKHVSPAVALKALQSILEAEEEWETNLSISWVAGAEATELLRRAWSGVPDQVLSSDVAAVLRTWITLIREETAKLSNDAAAQRLRGGGGTALVHARLVAAQLPENEAVSFTDFLLAEPQWASRGFIVASLPFGSEAQQARLQQTLLSLEPGDQIVALQRLAILYRAKRGDAWPERLATVLLDTTTGLLKTGGPTARQITSVVTSVVIPSALYSLKPDAARTRLISLMSEIGSLPESSQEAVLKSLFPYWQNQVEIDYGTQILIPSLEQIYQATASSNRGWILTERVVQMIKKNTNSELSFGAVGPVVAQFILNHPGDSFKYTRSILFARRDLFPLQSWVPQLPDDQAHRIQIPKPDGNEQLYAECRELMSDPANHTRSTFRFLSRALTAEQQNELFLPFLDGSDTTSISHIMEFAKDLPVDALESAVTRYSDDPKISDQAVWVATSRLRKIRPSKLLFPAVRRLLRADMGLHVLASISMAESLGQRELVPDLIRLLDSMDGRRRKAARAAIDSILELDRLRNEAARDPGTSESPDDK